MDFAALVEGPLLWIAMFIFFGAVLARLCFFVGSIVRSSKGKEGRPAYVVSILGRFLAPLHMLMKKRPQYSALRILFHLCMVVVPVWLSSHIVYWEISWLGWSWASLPWWAADGLTLVFITLVIFFVMRRMIVPEVSQDSSAADYALLAITGLPFLTGFFSTHGILESFPFLGPNMQAVHELTGEVMMVAAAVLFCRPRINEEKCIGCAACELACPTGTLETSDEGIHRIFHYSHYQCICCANCAQTCPEDAADLRHELSGRRFFQIASKYTIRSVELKECRQCGARFAPEPQMDKIKGKPEFEKMQQALEERQMRLCPQCRKISHAEVLYRVAPKPKKPTRSMYPKVK